MKSTKQVLINCSSQRLWEVLTKPEFTKEYMFNCEVDSNWKEGSTITWSGEFEGHKAFQKGMIHKVSEGKEVTYSTFDPNFGLEDKPENYIHVTYTLHEMNHETQLTIVNETFDENPERMSHIKKGWDMVIPKIKQVAETIAG